MLPLVFGRPWIVGWMRRIRGRKHKNTLERLKVDILSLNEIKLPNAEKLNSSHKTRYYSGTKNTDHWNGVGILLKEELNEEIISFVPFSNRYFIMKLAGLPININNIQIYASTAHKSEQELEKKMVQK